MKQKKWLVALIFLAIVSMSCGLPDFVARAPEATVAPTKTLRPTFTAMPPATNTVAPTSTPVPTDTPLPTSTPVPPTNTPVPPTLTPVPPTPVPPTETPVPPTATPAPTKTAKPKPKPTQKPPTAVPPPQPKHVVGAHGVSGLVIARDKTTFAVGEKAYFTYEALNPGQDPVGFEKLGIKASNGLFNTSWINPDFVMPGVPFRHDDGLTFTAPGTYQVFLAICFAPPCETTGGVWEEFPHGAATITVK